MFRSRCGYQIKRQSELLDKGEKIVQETRRIAEDGKTYAMREKVDAVDYKYFVEPNIPPVPLSDEYLKSLKDSLPELKLERYNKYIEKYGLSEYDAGVLSANRETSDYFEEVLSYGSDVELSVNFVTTAILSTIKKLEIDIKELFITPKMLSGVIDLVHKGDMSLDHGKKLLYKAIEEKTDPMEIVKRENLHQINDESELLTLISGLMDENPEQVRQYVEDDNKAIINFFIGQTMKRSNRQANPNKSLEIIKQELEKRKNNA